MHRDIWFLLGVAVSLITLCPHPVRAQDAPVNTTAETAALISIGAEDLVLVPRFDLAPEQWWRWTAPEDGLLQATSPYAAILVRSSEPQLGPGTFPVRRDTEYLIRAAGDSPAEVFFRFDWAQNDHFSNAIHLDASGVLSAVVRGSTLEPNEPFHGGQGSVWWRWTAPRDGILRLPFLVYQGESLDTLIQPERDDLDWVVRGGVEYFLAFTGSGPVDALVSLQPEPAHASFEKRLSLGNEALLLKQVDLPRAVGFQERYIPSTWWEWQSPAEGHLLIESSGRFGLRRYVIEDGERLEPIETNTVELGRRYAFEIYNDSSAGSDFIVLRFSTTIGGNDQAETAFAIDEAPFFMGHASSETGSLHWEWRADADAVVHVRQGLLPERPAAVAPLRRRSSGQEEFTEAEPMFAAAAGVTYHFLQSTLDPEPHYFQLEVFPLPLNDDRSGAIDLGSVSRARSRSSWLGSSREPDEPEGVIQSTWWKWSAPEDGVLCLYAPEPAELAIYDESREALLIEGVNPSNFRAAFTLGVSRGQRLAISVRSPYEHGALGMELDLDFEPGPANDAFDRAFDLGGQNDVRIELPGWAGSREPGEPIHGEGELTALQRHSRWWRWRPRTDQWVSVIASGQFSVYTGSAVDALSPVPLARGPFSGSFAAREGTLYHIALAEMEPNLILEVVSLHLQGRPPTVNDAFEYRIPVSSTATRVLRTAEGFSDATLEEGEPSHELLPGSGSRWWTWTAPKGETLRVQIENGLLGVYTGTTLSELQPVEFVGDGPFTTAAAVNYHVFEAEPEVTYQIATPGHLTMRTVPLAKVRHDHFEHAIDLGNVEESLLEVSFIGSTADGQERGLVQQSVRGGILWWRWTAPRDGQAHLAAGSATRVFRGTELADLERILIDQPTRLFPVSGGESYWIAVGFQSVTDINLALSMDGPMPDGRRAYFHWITERLPGGSASLKAPEADPDDDGLPNLLEWAFGLDPLRADARVLTFYKGNSADSYERIDLPANRLPHHVRLGFQSSSNLRQWQVLSQSHFTLTEIQDRWEIDFFPGIGSSRFFRVIGEFR